MTVASVIHQPRTDIYAMFDSLFLLGVGGCTVYHGPANEAKDYFLNLGHHLKEGDSQADWFLDISSGDVNAHDIEQVSAAMADGESVNNGEEYGAGDNEKNRDGEQEDLLLSNEPSEGNDLMNAQQNREHLYKQWAKYYDNIPPSKKKQYYLAPSAFDLPKPVESVPAWHQFIVQLRRNLLLSWRNRFSRLVDFGIVVLAVFAITLLGGVDPSAYDYDPSKILWISFVSDADSARQFLQHQIFTWPFRGLNALSN